MFRSLVAQCASPFSLAMAGHREEITHKGDVTDVRVVRHMKQHPEAWKLWQPYIVQARGLLSTGRRPEHLVCAYGAMIRGKTDMGSIWASISTDDGDTWEEPTPIFDHTQRQGAIQFGYANPALFAPPGQDVIWCFGQRCPIVRQNSPDAELVGAFSADGGRSWTPVEMAMTGYHGPLIVTAEPFPTEIDGRRVYLLPAHRNSMQKDPLLGTRDHFVLSSTSLLEWKLEAYIPQPEDGKVFSHEGCIAPGDVAGEIKIVMRTANYHEDRLTTDPPRAYSSVSRDGGRTWSPARAEPDLYNAKSKAWFGRAANGTHLYVYNDGPPQREGGRNALRYKTKAAGGVWSAEKTFYDASVKNSYPTLIEKAPGEFYAVWDSGTASAHRTHIVFGKLRIHS